MDAERFSDLVGDIYDAALDARVWPRVLAELAEAFGSRQANLTREKPLTNEGEIVTHGSNPEFERLYVAYYMGVNELTQRAVNLPTGTLLSDRTLMDRREYFRTEFRNDFLRPQDVDLCLASVLRRSPEEVAMLSFWRAHHRGEWEDGHFELLRRLTPHVQRALKIDLKLNEQTEERYAFAAALDRLQHGALIVDDSGKPVFVSGAAEKLLEGGDGLAIDKNELRASAPAENAARKPRRKPISTIKIAIAPTGMAMP